MESPECEQEFTINHSPYISEAHCQFVSRYRLNVYIREELNVNRCVIDIAMLKTNKGSKCT